MYTLRQGQWIPQTMPSIVIKCKMMSECPSTEVCYTGKVYHLASRWCWNHSKRKKSPGFLSLLLLSAIFYVSKFLCLKTASWKRGNDSHSRKWYFFFCSQMWEKVTEEHVCMHAKLLQLCLTLCNSMDRSSPGSSVYRILQATILEWVAMPFSRGSSPFRDWTCISYVSCTGRGVPYPIAT